MNLNSLPGKNALVSLAYLKSGEKPIESISQLVYYSMIKSSVTKFSLSQIQEAIYNKCRLKLPVGIIKLCLNELCQSNLVQYDRVVKIYSQINEGFFDLKSFELRLEAYGNAELNVLNEFIRYLDQEFNVIWSLDEARSAIIEFLVCGENAATIFIGDQLSAIDETLRDVKKSWYFASFVENEKNNSQIMGYIQDLAYGYAKCIGLLGSSDKDGNININQNLSNTEFYFDTKLILRFLGYSYESEVKATQELVSFIRNAGGLTRVFQKNLEEVGSALYNAAVAIRKNQKTIEDVEMDFCLSDDEKAKEVSDKFGNSNQIDLLETLLISKGFVIVNENSSKWNERRMNFNNIDVTKLENFIAMNSNWKRQAICNDVDAINRINRLRGGDYSVYFGSRRKFPVFVTSNYFLIRCIILYAKEPNSNINWGSWCLPLISDSLLTYSLWLKNERHDLNIENAIVSKMIFALNHSDSKFRAKLLEETKRLQAASPDDIPFFIETAHTDTLRDVIRSAISATNGDAENLTHEIIIMSENEAIKNRTYQQRLDNERLEKEKEQLTNDKNKIKIELEKTKSPLKEQEIAHLVQNYEYTIPFLKIKTFFKMILLNALPIFGLIPAFLATSLGYLIEKKSIGLAAGIIIVILSAITNYLIPPYRNWVNEFYIRSSKRKLQKYIYNTTLKLAGKTEYIFEVIIGIQENAFLKYNIKEEGFSNAQ